MSLPDIAKVIEIVAAVADEEIMPRFQSLQESEIRVKSHPGDIVTDADVMAERALTTRLADLLPGSVVVGEESVYADKSLLNRIAEDAPVWIVDPVDGTANYAHGKPVFGTIVALSVRAEVVMGLIYDPVARSAVTAERGAGAWRGEKRLSVTGKGAELAALDGDPGCRNGSQALADLIHARVRYNASAHDYMAMADGITQFSVAEGLNPWDHAAGVLIHSEAGGVEKLIDGTPYAPTIHKGRLIVAPDDGVWEKIRAVLVSE